MEHINLDYAALTPVLPEVKQAMAESAELGNPSSIHQEGRRAKQALDLARKQVASLINAQPSEVYFTSCGTESNNWAVRGLASAGRRKGRHLIISAIEHPSVSLAARRLGSEGWDVTILPVDKNAVVSKNKLKETLKSETTLVSIMLANAEVGTIEPIAELAAIAHEDGCIFHTDAVAAAGHMSIDVKALGIDALSLSANQFYGPPGTAALFVREGVRILPLLEGGGQEHGGRSGTENVPAIVGMGAAAELASQQIRQRVENLCRLRNRLCDGLESGISDLRFNGSWSARLPHNLHICVDGIESESLVLGLDQAGILVGMGSACNSKAMQSSHVLKAMGLSDEEAKGAIMLTLGVQTTEDEINRAIEIIPGVVEKLRRITAMTARTSEPRVVK